ncbi:MAG: response regulator [bacterium]|nr:response regulator [bacterium]
MQDQLLIVLPAGLIGIPAGIYFWRYFRGQDAMLTWSLAWLALWLSGTLEGAADYYPFLSAPANLMVVLFASLLLAGAFRFALRPVPRWLPAVCLTACIAAPATAVLVDENAGNMAVGFVTALILLRTAAVVSGNSRRSPVGPAARFLGPVIVVLGVLAAFNWMRYSNENVREILLASWYTGSFAAIFLQLLIFAERSGTLSSRPLEERSGTLSSRLLEERELLRRIALVMGDDQNPREQLVQVLEETQYLDLFLAFGAWILPLGGDRLEYLAGHLPGKMPLPTVLRDPQLNRPILQTALASSGPLFLEDLAGDSRILPELRAAGLQRGFIAPLRVTGEVVGVLGAILAPTRPLDKDRRRFIGDLADVIALVLANLRLRDQQRDHTEALDAERRLFREMIEAVPEGILLTDYEGRVQVVNRHLCEQFGIAEPELWVGRLEREITLLVMSRIAKPIRDSIVRDVETFSANRELSFDPFEVQIDGESGTILLLSAQPVRAHDGHHLGRVWVSRDVTEERRMGERIQHAERMQTFGTLAGGLAHDFNNNLTAILGNAELIRSEFAADAPSLEMLDDLEQAAEHCADLTRGLLTFARQDPADSVPVEMKAAVAEVQTLLRPSMPPGVQLMVEVDETAGWVKADAPQLRRVLTNLIVNARDAMAREGQIRVEARRLQDGKEPAELELLVIDDGLGMDTDTQNRIFDPFFTTKEKGRGTGLGLAIVYSIVERHGGSITVSSAPGLGSTFRVTWPALLHPPQGSPEVVANPPTRPLEGVTVLLAEDETAVRRLARTTLESAGFRVLEAEDGDAAIACFRKHRDEISAAVFDLSMPQRDGLEALRAIRKEAPELPALIVSGHPDREQYPSWPKDVPLLPKPYKPNTLVARVAALLAPEADSPPVA